MPDSSIETIGMNALVRRLLQEERPGMNDYMKDLLGDATDAALYAATPRRLARASGSEMVPMTRASTSGAAAIQRWWGKANAYAANWKDAFGVVPTLHNVVLGLAVAQFETGCGDHWPGEHNWGAVQKRTPNASERTVLRSAGIVPNRQNVEPARRAIAAAIEAGTCPPLDREALHVDSSPISGWYFVYFWAFPDDVQGAALFVHVLAEQRPSCRQDLEAEGADEQSLAADMYRTHYYEGIHDPHKPGGVQANIDDYANALQRLAPGIRAELAGWRPGAVYDQRDPRTFDLATVFGRQQALNFLHVAVPLLVEDGVLGPKTTRAIEAFQAAHLDPATGGPLAVDGVVGPRTTAALKVAMGIG